MASVQIKQSLRDILPNHHGDFPPKLLDYINSLYQLSTRKTRVLPNKAEIARYHLCTYLVVERYKDMFNLPEPDIMRIPIQPRLVSKLLDDFRELIDQIASSSAASSPRSSPRKAKVAFQEPPTTPSRPSTTTTYTPVSGSPLKRMRQIQNEDDDPEVTPNTKRTKQQRLKDIESPFNPKKIQSTPTKLDENNKEQKSPSRRSYFYDRKTVLLLDFISFCNNFHIPAEISAKMVQSFLIHKHKFVKKSDWWLATAMIHAAYIRINNKLLSSKVGAKNEFLELLFQYQKGGLVQKNFQFWCDTVNDWIKDEQWVVDMEKKYMYTRESMEEANEIAETKARIGEGWDLLCQFGAMVNGEMLFESDTQKEYYETWSKSVLDAVEVEVDVSESSPEMIPQ